MPPRDAAAHAPARVGPAIASVCLILAGTFASLTLAGDQVLTQVGRVWNPTRKAVSRQPAGPRRIRSPLGADLLSVSVLHSVNLSLLGHELSRAIGCEPRIGPCLGWLSLSGGAVGGFWRGSATGSELFHDGCASRAFDSVSVTTTCSASVSAAACTAPRPAPATPMPCASSTTSSASCSAHSAAAAGRSGGVAEDRVDRLDDDDGSRLGEIAQ